MKLSVSNRTAIIVGLVIAAVFVDVKSAYSQAVLGARPVSLGQATTALPESAWAVFENPAMISANQHTVSFFGIRYYGLPELSDVAAVITYPTNFGVIGGGAHRYGNDVFSESRIRLTYKNSYQNFHYGFALNYNHVAQGGGYGSFGALGIDVGIAALIIDNLWIGAKATNINQGKYGEANDIVEEVPQNLSIGFSYRLSGVALFTTDVIKDVSFPIAYRAGVEIDIVENFKARAGITTAPQTFSGGFGYNARQWGVNLVVQRHEETALGYSPGLDFNFSW